MSALRTLQPPHEPVPRLADLLNFLASPEARHAWLLLDVKTDDDAEDILTRAGQTIEEAGTATCERTGRERPWNDRIVFGGWNVRALAPQFYFLFFYFFYFILNFFFFASVSRCFLLPRTPPPPSKLQPCRLVHLLFFGGRVGLADEKDNNPAALLPLPSQDHYMSLITTILPGYAAVFIGFSPAYARRFLKIANVGFNMLQKAVVGPFGSRFVGDVRAADRPLFVWTVNDAEWMEWSIAQRVDGVVTDDPKLFLDVCNRWELLGACCVGGDDAADNERDNTARRAFASRTSPLARIIKLYVQAACIQLLICLLGHFFLRYRTSRRRSR